MDKARPPPTILIAGPTASGKTALAVALAERLGGVVINADSMQVYRELRVITARPDAADVARAPHKLYGHVPAAEAYSAGRFVAEAAAEIGAAHAAGLAAIVTGGTGLYFHALTDGLSPMPQVPEAVREHWRAEAQRHGAAALHAELARRDPEMAARLRPTDPQRVTRALEILAATGRSLAEWQRIPGRPATAVKGALKFVLAPERSMLNARCDARFERMLADGAEAEVAGLMALALDPALPAMRAVGVRPLAGLIAGRLSRSESVAAAQAETRQLAKRQMTWLRGNMTSWKWLEAQETKSQLADCMAFIQS
jgi:tRNA dimethylallyltransferase